MKKGFTLIEVLVVVAIIGVLASMILVGLGGARSQGRDARRIADLRSIQSGLELHFARFGQYPLSLTDPDFVQAVRTIPSDPNPAFGYGYCVRSADRGAYVLAAYLESAGHPSLREYADSGVFTGICTVSVPGAPPQPCSSRNTPTRTYCTTL